MPWHIARSVDCPASKPWAVLKDADGEVEGCHANRDAANAQLAALYAGEPRSAGRDELRSEAEPYLRLPDIHSTQQISGGA